MEKVSLKEKLGFSIGEYSSSVVWQTLMFFLPIFYTDTFGMTATAVGTMFLVVRLFDAFTDPIMGIVADRTETRWGKFRPYILWLAVPYGLGTVLMFTTPDLAGDAKVVYAYVTYSIMMVIYTAIMIPYNSLIGVISPVPDERTSVSSFKFVFAYAAGFSVQLLIIPLVKKLGAGDDAQGYQYTMAIFATLCVIFFIVSFLSVRERVKPDPAHKSNVRDDLKDLFHNKPWIILFFLSLATLIYVAIRSADIAYYFKYFIKNEEIIASLKAASDGSLLDRVNIILHRTGTFMAVGTVFVLLGVLPTKWLSSRIGKKKLYIICMLIITVSSSAFILAGPEDMLLIYVAQIIFSLASGPTMPLLWSMLADAADYSQWKNNRRATGLVYSAATFAQKAGFSLGGAIVMAILSVFGFVANQPQTESSILGIKLSMSVVPAAVAFIGAILLLFYKLDDATVAQIEKDLAKRQKDRA
jgi:GPH family glycoside/pentoside/hexuronide:cation symporter